MITGTSIEKIVYLRKLSEVTEALRKIEERVQNQDRGPQLNPIQQQDRHQFVEGG